MKRNYNAPISKDAAMTGPKLADCLKSLIGKEFVTSRKPRTDGASLRKMIEAVLATHNVEIADESTYHVVPKKGKGVPKMLRYLADSYIVTKGTSYNLQVWNRIPNSLKTLIKYADGSKIRSCDILLILVKIDTEKNIISSIIVATPKHIEHCFGKFGVPTIKYQAIINPSVREKIISSTNKTLLVEDTTSMKQYLSSASSATIGKIADDPSPKAILSIDQIAKRTRGLLGQRLESTDTKTRGQALERLVATCLGYSESDALVGGYPDIRHQALEVKVQDSPTIDLGKESPSNPIRVFDHMELTTEDVRYFIALTNPNTSIIEGIILVPGSELENAFTMVDGTNFKCQRNIPMSYFAKYAGQSVFNPEP